MSEEKRCPFCAETILADARKCKHCGEFLDGSGPNNEDGSVQKWSPGVAAVLSLIIPGAGQMYKGQAGSGIVWLFAVVVGYVIFILPGLVLHVFCILSAASSGNRSPGNERNPIAVWLIVPLFLFLLYQWGCFNSGALRGGGKMIFPMSTPAPTTTESVEEALGLTPRR